MHDSIRALQEQFELNTRLFLNSLDGVDDNVALNRPGPGSNHMAFVACHLLDARCFLARFLGAAYDNPYQERFDSAQSIDEMRDFPPVEGLCAVWRAFLLMHEAFHIGQLAYLRKFNGLEPMAYWRLAA